MINTIRSSTYKCVRGPPSPLFSACPSTDHGARLVENRCPRLVDSIGACRLTKRSRSVAISFIIISPHAASSLSRCAYEGQKLPAISHFNAPAYTFTPRLIKNCFGLQDSPLLRSLRFSTLPDRSRSRTAVLFTFLLRTAARESGTLVSFCPSDTSFGTCSGKRWNSGPSCCFIAAAIESRLSAGAPAATLPRALV